MTHIRKYSSPSFTLDLLPKRENKTLASSPYICVRSQDNFSWINRTLVIAKLNTWQFAGYTRTVYSANASRTYSVEIARDLEKMTIIPVVRVE